MPPKAPKADVKKPSGGVRGVSAEEKSRRMLEIFKSAEVYSMKELEKLGAKKGAQTNANTYTLTHLHLICRSIWHSLSLSPSLSLLTFAPSLFVVLSLSPKGVLSQVIPDVVKGLVDDGLVDMDKIGGGNFFWALPSKQGQRKKARLDVLKVCTLFFDNHINLLGSHQFVTWGVLRSLNCACMRTCRR